MARLEEMVRGAAVRGILPDGLVTIIDATWRGRNAVELTYKDATGRLGNELVFRESEPSLEIAAVGKPWSFDVDGEKFRLVSEARRIRLAYLFDPHLAVHTSLVEPLPHQITAVYGEMLTRQPLRFLLADDPGAGKTIMAGLLVKELLIRGDVQRCLVVCPGILVEQWQDELFSRFQLPFEILTNDKVEAARTGNWFAENPLAICRLDKLSRDEDVKAKLEATDWDLVIVDEAHKMSASFFGGEVKYTKRYHLGQLLARLTRHFLLLTATPHNGKEEDFQLFLALLDGDRFEGRFRDGVHLTDASDLMRRLVKEQLLTFDGTPLFPERRAYTVNYRLSPAEAALYQEVTEYVREEFNHADALGSESGKGTVGFALTILQRRLASSPEAIYQSIQRRRSRLEKRLREERLLKRGAEARVDLLENLPVVARDDVEEYEDAPEPERAAADEKLVDQASAARTVAELEAEIAILERLEELALRVRRSGHDRKWEELSQLLQENPEMFDGAGARRKLVIFTEHRDTLRYLVDRIQRLLGRDDAVAAIHGGMGREERRTAQEEFLQNPDVQILVATDAAGEGINLQRAHLMVNYDLPWNPNRLEQRFGRIHRIGQTEVCHLWNLVAAETREGAVFHTLCAKLEEESKALDGRIFDVLGKAFTDTPLRDLLLEAIRYGDRPEVRAHLHQVIDAALDRRHLTQLIDERALARDTMDAVRVSEIREELERAAARRLQPHFIAAFFLEAFRSLSGTVREREVDRYEITHVPASIRHRDRQIGTRAPVLSRYERVCFDKSLISEPGKPLAEFVCPGHPLLDATIDLIRERNADLLKRGAVLVDPNDPSDDARRLVYLEHTIQDARINADGSRRVVSRQLQFLEKRIPNSGSEAPERNGRASHPDDDGEQNGYQNAGYAPYLNYATLNEADRAVVQPYLEAASGLLASPEEDAISYAVEKLVPRHFAEVKRRKEELVQKTMAAVKDRLTKEITYWDHRAVELKEQEQAGKTSRLNSTRAQQRADELQARLARRLDELEQERKLSPLPPVVVGGALVIPKGLIDRLKGIDPAVPDDVARERARIERLAMATVLEVERRLGYDPRDVSRENLGYDIESRVLGTGRLRFVEVKGRAKGATTVTVTKNEILTALNQPDDYYLAIVEVDGDACAEPRYLQRAFGQEPDFGVTAVTYNIGKLIGRSAQP